MPGGVTVPSSYVPLVTEAAQGTGLPYNVVAAQASAESGFQAAATSSAGAEGWLQFLPSTYAGVAAQAGVPPNSEYNPSDEVKAYIVYMNQLLQEEGGSIYKALEAYNAGPGNLQAGANYAGGIMAAAGTPTNTTATQQATDTSIHIPGTNINIPGLPSFSFPSVTSIGSDLFSSIVNGFLKAVGLPSLKDALERFALILLGFVLVIVGIWIFANSSGGGGQPIQITNTTAESPEGVDTTSTRRLKGPGVSHTTKSSTTTKVKGAGKSIAGEAAEAAIAA